MLLETRWFEITRRRHAIRGLHPDLAGLRLVQLTDIHHGPAMSLNYVREVIAATNALKPDLILLTGDYVHRSPAYIDPVVRELSELRASIGVVGVLGNHDWWESAPLSRECFAKAGIPLIDNDRLLVSPDRKFVDATRRPDCASPASAITSRTGSASIARCATCRTTCRGCSSRTIQTSPSTRRSSPPRYDST